MEINSDYTARRNRVMKWYAPSRIGLFVHWGFFTGGGMTTANSNFVPLTYRTPEEFEKAAPEPGKFAANIAALAKRFGAKYINFTLIHAADGYAAMFPTRQPEFLLKTSKDYLGALLDVCQTAGLRLIVYFPLEIGSAEAKGGPYAAPGTDARGLYGRLVEELAERYGNRIAGFWLDGGFTTPFLDFPAHIRKYFPEAVINVNSCTFCEVADVDFSVTEFTASTPSPAYDRPSALRSINKVGVNVPPDDFNEDIPNCASWWYWKNRGRFAAGIAAKETCYLADRFFLLRQMLCSIGQRGQWNFTFGIPVRIDGTVEEKYHPMFDAVSSFLEWGSEAVYNTTGGLDSPIRPGSFHGGGFCSVTRSLENPSMCFLLVIDPPKPEKNGFFLLPPTPENNFAAFFTKGRVPVCVSDLRTGTPVEFTMPGGNGFCLRGIDWSDTERYGVKVFRVEFEYPETPTAL